MNTLFFIRHAESEANKKRILGSRIAFPLTSAGKADAELIAGELKNLIPINHIIASPLLRAQQTAAYFAQAYNLSTIVDHRITEQHLGKYSGMGYDEVKSEPLYEQDALKRWNWVPEGGGESYEMVAQRILDFFKSLEDSPLSGNTLIVTHAVSFRLIRAILECTLPVYPHDFPNNGEIWKVEYTKIGEFHKIESIFLGNSKNFAHNP